jgi:hypothetical protein
MITTIFIILAGACNGVMDAIRDKFHISRLPKKSKWWLSTDWKAKYVDNDPSKPIKWYWQLLSWFDAWHFFKWWMIMFFALAIVSYEPCYTSVADACILATIFACTFLLFYKVILIKPQFRR